MSNSKEEEEEPRPLYVRPPTATYIYGQPEHYNNSLNDHYRIPLSNINDRPNYTSTTMPTPEIYNNNNAADYNYTSSAANYNYTGCNVTNMAAPKLEDFLDSATTGAGPSSYTSPKPCAQFNHHHHHFGSHLSFFFAMFTIIISIHFLS